LRPKLASGHRETLTRSFLRYEGVNARRGRKRFGQASAPLIEKCKFCGNLKTVARIIFGGSPLGSEGIEQRVVATMRGCPAAVDILEVIFPAYERSRGTEREAPSALRQKCENVETIGAR